MAKALDQLEQILRAQPGPFLFIGSGLSRRYLNLPDWPGLLAHFASEAGRPFDYYRGAASGYLPAAASLIAADFYDVWWNSDTYADQRAQWAHAVDSPDSVLKIAVAELLISMSSQANRSPLEAQEFQALKNVVIEGIITTNFDGMTAEAFPTFKEYVGQDDLLLADMQGIAESYLIHGSVSDPASLVLTEPDYSDFNARNSYLAAKLMTIFVEHPVVFLGYSLTDKNIRQILISLVRGLRGRSVEALQDRLIVVEWEATAEPTVLTTALEIDGVDLPIVRVTVPDFLELFAILKQRVRPMPARVLRNLKEQIFEIVKSGDPTGRLYAVSDIDESSEELEFVYGIAAKMTAVGIVGLNRFQIMDDILECPDRDLPAEQVLTSIVGKTAAPTYIPVFKYLRRLNLLNADGSLLDPTAVPERVAKRADTVRGKLQNLTVQDAPSMKEEQCLKPVDRPGWAYLPGDLVRYRARPALQRWSGRHARVHGSSRSQCWAGGCGGGPVGIVAG